MQWLHASGRVEGELSDEAPVDEDVAGGSGDHGERVVAGVDGSDGDGVAVDADDAGDDAGAVDGAGRSQRAVGGPGFGCVGPHVSGDVAADSAVASVMVVVVPEQVQECL